MTGQTHSAPQSQLQTPITPTQATPLVRVQPQPQRHSKQPQQQQPQPQRQKKQHRPQDIKPDFSQFDVSQLEVPQQNQQQQQSPQQQQTEQVGMAMVPDNDFSKLKINPFNSMDFSTSYQSVNAFALTDIPPGPNPANLLSDPSAPLPESNVNFELDCLPTRAPESITTLLSKLDGAARTLRYGAVA